MAQALATLRTLAEALRLCKRCTNKLTGGDGEDATEKEKPVQPANDITYHSTSLTDVRFADCDLKNVIAKRCDWNNVVFTNCSFLEVVFDGLKMSNVHFFNLELDHVRLRDVVLRQTAVSDMKISKALLGGASFGRVSITVPASAFTRTTASSVPRHATTKLLAFPCPNNLRLDHVRLKATAVKE